MGFTLKEKIRRDSSELDLSFCNRSPELTVTDGQKVLTSDLMNTGKTYLMEDFLSHKVIISCIIMEKIGCNEGTFE